MIDCKMFEFKAVAEVQIKYVARLTIVRTVHDAIHALRTYIWLDVLICNACYVKRLS